MKSFDEWLQHNTGYHFDDVGNNMRRAWDAAIEAARAEAMDVNRSAYDAAESVHDCESLTDYVKGYQDAAVDVDEALRGLLTNPVSR
jgi:hypothetical protein